MSASEAVATLERQLNGRNLNQYYLEERPKKTDTAAVAAVSEDGAAAVAAVGEDSAGTAVAATRWGGGVRVRRTWAATHDNLCCPMAVLWVLSPSIPAVSPSVVVAVLLVAVGAGDSRVVGAVPVVTAGPRGDKVWAPSNKCEAPPPGPMNETVNVRRESVNGAPTCRPNP
ncbi:hypothetical protein OBBRIDRAFT_839784 [Obba rivulosa]|uniref:Uncharacterized protein n=1 Tax=Obba rivulosa TaxID=1052685 RepID=A0A8E2DEW2_9APHY|nr:hypothetical protein OBBRIDRAFT_839784 [Obba rivulosa]